MISMQIEAYFNNMPTVNSSMLQVWLLQYHCAVIYVHTLIVISL